jgi:hypothetical protein
MFYAKMLVKIFCYYGHVSMDMIWICYDKHFGSLLFVNVVKFVKFSYTLTQIFSVTHEMYLNAKPYDSQSCKETQSYKGKRFNILYEAIKYNE